MGPHARHRVKARQCMSQELDRRRFLRLTAASTAAMAGLTGSAATEGRAMSRMRGKRLREEARDVSVVEEADVLVAGAGPAGVAAAIAAARAGAEVRLLERAGCLGGTWTAGLLSWIIDSGNKSGIVKEFVLRLEARGTGTRFGGSVAYEPEVMKIVLEEMCIEAGVRVQLHTLLVSAVCDADGRLRWAVTESKSGRQAWAAEVFVDATGDGDLAARAGCSFDYGHEQTGDAQPMSLICLVVGLDPAAVTPFVRGLAEPAGRGDPKAALLAEMRRAGVTPSYVRPTIFHLGRGLFCFMINHEYGVRGSDAAETTQATLQARAEVHSLIEALRRLGKPWTDVRIVATPEHIGVREGRRIRGLYQITTDDLVRGARFDDAVCRCRFGVDVHSTNPKKDKGITRSGVRAKPYDIPYRSLVARDVGGLLLAGRCISGDFLAHSSYRVTGNAAATGQAAGAAAVLAAKTSRQPRDLPWPEVAAVLADAAETGRRH